MTTLFIPIVVLTVLLLLRAEFLKNKKQIYIWKPLSTLLIIVVCLLSLGTAQALNGYTGGILIGLVLSLGGDVFLIFPERKKVFMVGLVLFLLAHIAYLVTFTVYNGVHVQDIYSGLILVVLALLVYVYLRPGLGPLKGPVMVYVLAISLMLNRALSTWFGEAFSSTQVGLIILGAGLFYVSDLILAINRFRKSLSCEQISLAFYYAGQLLIALSASYFE